jgi:hypothetical protein
MDTIMNLADLTFEYRYAVFVLAIVVIAIGAIAMQETIDDIRFISVESAKEDFASVDIRICVGLPLLVLLCLGSIGGLTAEFMDDVSYFDWLAIVIVVLATSPSVVWWVWRNTHNGGKDFHRTRMYMVGVPYLFSAMMLIPSAAIIALAIVAAMM